MVDFFDNLLISFFEAVFPILGILKLLTFCNFYDFVISIQTCFCQGGEIRTKAADFHFAQSSTDLIVQQCWLFGVLMLTCFSGSNGCSIFRHAGAIQCAALAITTTRWRWYDNLRHFLAKDGRLDGWIRSGDTKFWSYGLPVFSNLPGRCTMKTTQANQPFNCVFPLRFESLGESRSIA